MRRSTWFFSTMLSGVVGASLFALVTARAQGLPVSAPSLPAVDGFNGKVELLGGALNGHGVYGAAGSFAAPLSQNYGFQVDGLASQLNGSFAGGIGAHLFWRDPSTGLLGLYAAYSAYAAAGASNFAVEFERYWDRWTLQGIAGVEWGTSGFEQTGTSGLLSLPVGNSYSGGTRVFDQINLNYYVNDNAMVSVGHRYVGGKHALALGGEWALPHLSTGNGLTSSLFVEGRLGEAGYNAVLGGFRVYMGAGNKTLIRQHREDDPINWMPETLFGILNTGTQACNAPGYFSYDQGTNECGP